jgi:replicative DNA helicase
MSTTAGRNIKARNSAKKTITPFERECIEVIKQINEYKLIAEANAVSTIYKNPDLIRETSLKLEDISNNSWRVYFSIANDIINVEKKNTLDEITINMYLSKHSKLSEKYDEYNGYETIENAMAYIQEDNFDSYVSEIKKWNAVIKLAKIGFPVKDRLSEYVDSTAEDIYNELEALLNHTFVNVESEVKTFNACDGLHELVDKLNAGAQVGMPLSNADIINKEIGGINFNGNIYGLGASSGVGKSTTAINYLMPSVLKNNEKMVMMINEEDQDKVRKELLIWVSNNVFKKDIHKYILRDGHFSSEVLEDLHKAADYLEILKDRRNITIVPFEKYTAKEAIKVIKKYSSMGVRLFVLDTLKESSDSRNLDTWKSMERDMVDLYDVVKPAAKNVALFVTYQLTKTSVKVRYLTNNDVGQAKNIIDVFSVNLMMRRLFEDELPGGSHEIKAFKLSNKKNTKIPFKLEPDKHYMITFITKNRFGQTDAFQIISEYDLSTNVNKDVAICNISQDW